MNLMGLIPYDKVTLETALPPQEITRRLRKHTGAEWALRFGWADETFFGKIEHDKFRVTRNSRFIRNSFKAVVRGTFEEGYPGTRINCTLYMHEVVMVFMAIFAIPFIGSPFLSGIAIFADSADVTEVLSMMVSICAGGVMMFGFVYGMMILGFRLSVEPVLRDLERVLEASRY